MIRRKGVEPILKESIQVNQPSEYIGGGVLSFDTTVQVQNTTDIIEESLSKKVNTKMV